MKPNLNNLFLEIAKQTQELLNDIEVANPQIGYKLVRQRADGTFGPLFINRNQRAEPGIWLWAENHPTSGFAVRPGWHICKYPVAPHLTSKRENRVWVKVHYWNATPIPRPDSQGGEWVIAQAMKIIGKLDPVQVELAAVDFKYKDQPETVRRRIRFNILAANICQ